MAEYKITDFKKGEKVYHRSNSRLIMVAIDINLQQGEISCRWLDKNGNTQIVQFIPEELGKYDDIKLNMF